MGKANCGACGFCKYTLVKGSKDTFVQTGCNCGQLERIKATFGKSINNDGEKIYELFDAGDKQYHILRIDCPFGRTPEYVEENINPQWTVEETRNFILELLPFYYGLVVLSDHNYRRVLNSCKSVIKGSIQPEFIEISWPFDKITDRSKETLFVELKEFLRERNPNVKWNIRQIITGGLNTLRARVMDCVKAQQGYSFILILDEGSIISEDFIKSIKELVYNNFFNFDIITMSKKEALITAPVFHGDSEFNSGRSFKYENGQCIQHYNEVLIDKFINRDYWIQKRINNRLS